MFNVSYYYSGATNNDQPTTNNEFTINHSPPPRANEKPGLLIAVDMINVF